MFDIEDYHYELPSELIAQVPASKRDESRLFVVDREERAFSEGLFVDLPEWLITGDLLIVNDTRVIPAKIFGKKESGGRIEILVLPKDCGQEDPEARTCLLRSSKRPKEGGTLWFDGGLQGVVQETMDDGLVRIRFTLEGSLDAFLEEKGHMPLPPYIRRGRDNPLAPLDRERYQTVFGEEKGSVAAPTAGLHFTPTLIQRLKEKGISTRAITLHVGYGTFQPVRTKDVRRHRLAREFYRIRPETADAIAETRQRRSRVIAVGTTVVRALETAAKADGGILPGEGLTEILITPGFSFKVVDALITNFHLPKSSLLFLVAAFSGMDLMREAYSLAVERGFRFFSYGDAMLIL